MNTGICNSCGFSDFLIWGLFFNTTSIFAGVGPTVADPKFPTKALRLTQVAGDSTECSYYK